MKANAGSSACANQKSNHERVEAVSGQDRATGHTLALTSNGSVLAWRENNFGQTVVPVVAQSANAA
jgi:hypothetical protein